eukprot:TRINITY_DN10_c0_g3_i1.p1 TRINITY_DN10_c0_g3~~TRINITY_DN10_c0_g3_i1.p1  ORF type:complete len:376 (+),score=40.13 TRINITY_DN10_c0_g3_i1:762-1889(+)
MKAAFLCHTNSQSVVAEIRDVAIPSIDKLPAGVMLMKTVATSVCGSDLWGKMNTKDQTWRGVIDHYWNKEGAVGGSGHEVVAEVIQVNEPCKRKVGNVVLCMTTNYLQGVDSVREEYEKATNSSADDLPSQGSFCEYFISYDSVSVLLPQTVPYPDFDPRWYVAAQPLGTILHAIKNLETSSVPIVNQTIAVVGQGQNGLLMTKVLSKMGCKKLIAVDRIKNRLDKALLFGATDAVLVENETSARDEIIRLTGDQVDISIEMVGHHGAALDLCTSITRNSGTVLVFGLPPSPTHSVMKIAWDPFARNVRFITTHAPSMETFTLAMSLIESGRVSVSDLFTHRFNFSLFPEAYDAAANYKLGVIKTLITFENNSKL